MVVRRRRRIADKIPIILLVKSAAGTTCFDFIFMKTILAPFLKPKAPIIQSAMHQFKKLPNAVLVNLLAEHTALYTQMLTNNIKTEEFYTCKQTIEMLTAEFMSRKKSDAPGELSVDSAISRFNEE